MTQKPPKGRDPVLDAIENAPLDDEPLTDEERRQIAEAKKGPFITTDVLRQRLAAARSKRH